MLLGNRHDVSLRSDADRIRIDGDMGSSLPQAYLRSYQAFRGRTDRPLAPLV